MSRHHHGTSTAVNVRCIPAVSFFCGRERYCRIVFAFSRNLVAFDELIDRIPIVSVLECLHYSDNSVGDLYYIELLTRTNPRPAVKREIGPMGRIQLRPLLGVKVLGILAEKVSSSTQCIEACPHIVSLSYQDWR